MLPRPPNINYIILYYLNKEEPHTNIKDLPKQLAKLNVYIDNSLAICYCLIKVAYFDSVIER